MKRIRDLFQTFFRSFLSLLYTQKLPLKGESLIIVITHEEASMTAFILQKELTKKGAVVMVTDKRPHASAFLLISGVVTAKQPHTTYSMSWRLFNSDQGIVDGMIGTFREIPVSDKWLGKLAINRYKKDAALEVVEKVCNHFGMVPNKLIYPFFTKQA